MAMAVGALPDFAELTLALEFAGISVGAAEVHGSFCGAAVLLGPHAGVVWLKEDLAECDPQAAQAAEAAKLLGQVALTSFAMLEGGQMDFRLLLPSDDESLHDRTENLAMWCQGFMHGIAIGNQGEGQAAAKVLESEVAKEIVADFTEITRAAVDVEDADAAELNQAENEFFELSEYVRISAQLVFEDSVDLRGNSSSDVKH